MTRIIADISVSFDGFVTGPGPSPANGLGTGGEALQTWAFSGGPGDHRVLREGIARSGAVGTPLFTGEAPRTLVRQSVVSTSTATHLTYDVFR